MKACLQTSCPACSIGSIRTDPSRARATGGVGLGLTIAKQLVEAHSDTITVESEPRKGTLFAFELPFTSVNS